MHKLTVLGALLEAQCSYGNEMIPQEVKQNLLRLTEQAVTESHDRTLEPRGASEKREERTLEQPERTLLYVCSLLPPRSG